MVIKAGLMVSKVLINVPWERRGSIYYEMLSYGRLFIWTYIANY